MFEEILRLMGNGKATWAIALALTLLAGCAGQDHKAVRSRPPIETDQAADSTLRKVVLFRVVVDSGGRTMDAPWTRHFSGTGLYTIIAPANGSLANTSGFEPGRPDSASSDNGWGFLSLTPGAYQLAIEGTAIRFAMPGAKNADSEVSVPVGRAPPLLFVVPPQAGVYYIGTITLTCEDAMAYGESVRLICNEQTVRSEIKQASQVAARAVPE